MVDEYARWYDRHFDPDWQDILLTARDTFGELRPLAFELPRSSAHLQPLDKALKAMLFSSGGNMTHNPGYGALIALGLVNHLTAMRNFV